MPPLFSGAGPSARRRAALRAALLVPSLALSIGLVTALAAVPATAAEAPVAPDPATASSAADPAARTPAPAASDPGSHSGSTPAPAAPKTADQTADQAAAPAEQEPAPAPTAPTSAAARTTAAAAAEATGPVKVMIAGDSISHEFTGDYTWRFRIWQEFRRQGVPMNLVGPRAGNTGPIPFWIVPSWRTYDRHDSLGGSKLHNQKDTIASEVAQAQPDVVLLMSGFNDLNHGAAAPTVVEDMDTYLTNLFTARPETRVVLSPVLHTVIYPGTAVRTIDAPGGAIDTVNAGYAGLVAKYEGLGLDIRTVDTSAAWVPRRHTVDGVHPTSTGETIVAQRYGASLFQMGVLKTQPRLAMTYVPWIANPRAVVRQSGRTVRFSWDYYRYRLTMYWGVVKITGKGLRAPLVLTGRHFTSNVSTTRLRKGRYTVVLSPVRKWLVGRYGPPVSFTVR